MHINLDFSKASLALNTRWRGMGMVSGNNSSRLLMDYKCCHPEKYNELLKLMFGSTGIGIQHLKIEMGSDINSSSGTEPCTMRQADEKPDVTRGAGFMLCADAKKINPEITLDMLWWSEPLWIEKAADVYAARYSWYKANLWEAYKVYGLKFDFVSATQNERGWDAAWIKYLSNSLKNEKDCPYDFSKIKIVAGEEVCTWNQSAMMLNDKELLAAVDVIGSHYTSWSDDNTKKLRDSGKEIWFSEGSSPMGFSSGLYKYDGNGSGLNGLNGVLDVANRIITMYPGGKMTLCEFQPVIAAYYDGACYCHKQFITANTPWNGYYKLDPGFFMTLHFSQFIKKGWALLDDACFADGKPAGDGHAIGDAVYSYVSACNPETKDWTIVISNTTQKPIDYEITVPAGNSGKIFAYETTGWKISSTLNKSELPLKNGKLQISVKPNSLITISTLNKEPLKAITEINSKLLVENIAEADEKQNPVLNLPYTDDFSYSQYKKGFLADRGNAPLFTTDQGGAFEVESVEGKNCLVQKILKAEKAKEWGGTPEPVTCLGDDRWFNYSAQITVKFAPESEDNGSEEIYAGLGIRYNLAADGQNGYWVKLWRSGRWSFNRNNKEIQTGTIDGFNGTQEHQLFIAAENNLIKVQLDGQTVINKTAEDLKISLQGAGRVAVYSSYHKNMFANLTVAPVGKTSCVTRLDNFDDCFEFVENETSCWNHGLMESFKCYKRTVSHGTENSCFKLKFEGTGFNITGSAKEQAVLQVKIDSKIVENEKAVGEVNNREAVYSLNSLDKGVHLAEFKIIKGQISIDAVEIL